MPFGRWIGWLILATASMGVIVGAQAQSPSPADPQRPDGQQRAASDNGRPAAIPLKPPSRPDRGRSPGPMQSPSGVGAVVTVLGGLGIVLGAFFLLAWAMRRGLPGTIGLLPREALEVLGRSPLAGRQQVYLLRLGNKLVLVSVTPAGAETLSEVTEPDEVQRLLTLCRQEQPTSASSMFRHTLERFASRAGGREEPNDG